MADKISLINDDEVELHYNLEEDIINDESIKEDALLVDEDCSTTDKPIVNTTTRAKDIRKYNNNSGHFITGVDVTSIEAVEKRLKRAERFGTQVSSAETDNRLTERANRFGVHVPIINGERVKYIEKLPETPSEGNIRNDAVLIYGTNEMSTENVLTYFSEYGPSHLEWINDSSCIAVWEDPTSAHRAFLGKGLCPVLTEEVSVEENTDGPLWRLGAKHEKANQLLLRMATDADVKVKGSSQRSHYYKKYGNPNVPKSHQRRRKKPHFKNDMEQTGSSTGEDILEEMEIADDGSLDLISPSKYKKVVWYQDDTDMEVDVFGQGETGTRDVADLRHKLSSKRKHFKSRLG